MTEGGKTARSDLWGGAGWVLFGLLIVAGSLRMDRFESMGAQLYAMPGFVPGLLGRFCASHPEIEIALELHRPAISEPTGQPRPLDSATPTTSNGAASSASERPLAAAALNRRAPSR